MAHIVSGCQEGRRRGREQDGKLADFHVAFVVVDRCILLLRGLTVKSFYFTPTYDVIFSLSALRYDTSTYEVQRSRRSVVRHRQARPRHSAGSVGRENHRFSITKNNFQTRIEAEPLRDSIEGVRARCVNIGEHYSKLLSKSSIMR